MDFFSQQDQARRSSKLLLALFLLSVVILVILTNVLVAVTLFLFDEQIRGGYQSYQQALSTAGNGAGLSLTNFFSWPRFTWVSLAVSGVITCAIIYKWQQLSGGGKTVAEQLGGTRIYPNTDHTDQKQLLNVVEEMALAAGMPVPAVYLLSQERAINAFAAGSSPADAVIGVTQGCMDQLNREQLQGVIAHEFSHILNGDMCINIRLIAILHGILFVGLIGEVLLRGNSRYGYGHRSSMLSRRRSGDNRLAALGFGLLIIGWLGRFFGNGIKAAVSRQREYLADASAVQFTRNPQGIAGALKIIGGYQPSAILHSNKASEMRHLFFGQSVAKLKNFFATHPPLKERIARIDPHWNGRFITRKPSDETKPEEMASAKVSIKPAGARENISGLAAASVFTATADSVHGSDSDSSTIDRQKPTLNKLPSEITQQAHEPFGAIAIIYCLLLSKQHAARQRQMKYIQATKITGLNLLIQHLSPRVEKLDPGLRLSLIELAMPAIKCISAPQYKLFCNTLLLLIRADKKFELFEWCLYQLVRHYLDGEFAKTKSSHALYKNPQQIADEYQLVLSMLAHHGNHDPQQVKRAFHRGANTLGIYTLQLLAPEDCKLDDFSRAVKKLARCYPLLKPRLLKGLADCARLDGTINVAEGEMISAIAAVMDCPQPRLVNS